MLQVLTPACPVTVTLSIPRRGTCRRGPTNLLEVGAFQVEAHVGFSPHVWVRAHAWYVDDGAVGAGQRLGDALKL